ncbi:MAG: hypothetical protein H5T61_05380 [Thermoflexales bacterium]|nr:hypothetical protein [Thermoflexales bacterium]
MAVSRSATALTEEQVREIALQVVDEEIAALREELGRPGPEWGDVRQVWLALTTLADAQRRTEERVGQLAEAQARTEAQVRALAEAQARTEAQVRVLAEAQARTEAQVRALAEAQARMEEEFRKYREASEARFERIEAALAQLAEAQRRTEESLRSLAEFVHQLAARTEEQIEQLRSEVGRLANRLGLDLEADAEEVFWALAERKGMRILARPTPIVMDGEVDLAVPVETSAGQRAWVLIEVKGRLRRAEVEDWFKCLRNPSFQEKLRLHGVTKPYLPYMFALRVYLGAEEMAQETGIGVLTFRGEMVPAQLWE